MGKKADLNNNQGNLIQNHFNFDSIINDETSFDNSSYIFKSLSPAKPTKVFDTYWQFAAERQAIFFRKIKGEAPPWTNDSILSKYKFTNAYRASDRVSQYLIREVIYNSDHSPDDIFFRIILFKIFNKIETWQILYENLGNITYSEYSFDLYDAILTKIKKSGTPIFSGAYIMPTGNKLFVYSRKHQNFLKLLEMMMKDDVPSKIALMRSMQKAFDLLKSYPMIGDFLAYQYVIDLNYSELTNFSEMEFVVPGPGARDGIRKCFSDLGGLTEIEIISLMANQQEKEFEKLGLEFQSLWGRPLQLIDCQNLFCEVDKYSRLAHPEIRGRSGRTRIKQLYQPKFEKISYWYPPKWGLNSRIPQASRESA
jgi:hypothetical protein